MPYSLQRLLALVGATVLLVPMLIVAICIRLIDGKPVFFRQERLGRHGKPFWLTKFRTMKPDADSMLATGKDPSNRLTRTGPFLRKSGIDELPQLLNVLLGQMAIVGPRAVLPEVGQNIPDRYSSRFEVLPGLTGLAQILGRNRLPWSKRLALDVEYASRRSMIGDFGICIRTAIVLIRGTGHSPDRNSTEVDDLGLLPGSD